MADPKDLNPWAPLIQQLIPYYLGLMGKNMPGYGGQLNAGLSPMWGMGRDYAMQMAQSGGPQAWNQAQSFINMYSNPYQFGVFNPFTMGIEGYGQGQQRGQGQSPGYYGPPIFAQYQNQQR